MTSSTNQGRLCVFVLLVLSAGWACAQQPANRPGSPGSVAPREPEYAGTTRISERMLNEDAGKSVILPSEPGRFGEEPVRIAGGTAEKPVNERRPLPEGFTIARRPARLERQEGVYVAHVEAAPRQPEVPPLRILPNARLAMLESAVARSVESRRFLVTGRITEFQGANYLLLSNVAELVAPPEEPALRPTPRGALTETRPAAETDTRPSGPEPTAEELIRQLMKEQTPRSILPPPENRRTGTSPAEPIAKPLSEVPETERAHWPDDTLLSGRPARLVQDEAGAGWVLAFEDPGMRPVDGPVRVLPGRLLENALHLTAGGTRPVVLIVSGEVTAHKGANYILLSKVLVRRNMGNFR